MLAITVFTVPLAYVLTHWYWPPAKVKSTSNYQDCQIMRFIETYLHRSTIISRYTNWILGFAHKGGEWNCSDIGIISRWWKITVSKTHSINARFPIVFGTANIHICSVGLTNDSIGGPLSGPGEKMSAFFNSTSNLDAISWLSTLMFNESKEMKIVLGDVSTEWNQL